MIIQARLQQYVNRDIRDVQDAFRKGRGTRDQIANIPWTRSRKTSTSALLTMPKSLTVRITRRLWKILKKMGTPDHLTCPLRYLYAGQEATVRSGHGTTDCFQEPVINWKGVHQCCILLPAYLTYMQNTSCEMLGWIKHKL